MPFNLMSARNKQHTLHGFTLLEVVLAAALTALIALLLSQMALRGLASARSEQLSDRAHAVALSAEQLVRAHAFAGMQSPCPQSATRVNAVHRNAHQYWLDGWGGGAEVLASNSAATNAVKPLGVKAGMRAAGNDVLILRRVGAPGVVVSHDLAAGRFVLSGDAGDKFRAGDLAVVCDASTAVFFQITGVNGRTINYANIASVKPGNRAGALHSQRECGKSICSFNGALIGRYYSVAFYIGTGHSGNLSLFRKTLVVRRSAVLGILPYMLGSEVLGGVRHLSAEVVAHTSDTFIVSGAGTSVVGNIVGLHTRIAVNAGDVVNKTENHNAIHSFSVAL